MRIIAGTARGKKLTCSSGRSIRPTTDRAREALFSMLYSRLGPLQGLRVLDLFAGTGSLGLEALSRGASEAVFVEQANASVKILRTNIAHCNFTANSRVMQQDVLRVLKSLSGMFDLIFMDPPYDQGWVFPCLEQIDDSQLLAPDGMLCADVGLEENVPQQIGQLHCATERQYAGSKIFLFERETPNE